MTKFNLEWIDNKIWMRHELKRLRGKAARRRNEEIKVRLKEAHKPWHERINLTFT